MIVLPLDLYSRNISDGTGTYLDAGKGFVDVGPVKLIDDHVVKGDISAGSPDVAVWDSFDSTYLARKGNLRETVRDIVRAVKADRTRDPYAAVEKLIVRFMEVFSSSID